MKSRGISGADSFPRPPESFRIASSTAPDSTHQENTRTDRRRGEKEAPAGDTAARSRGLYFYLILAALSADEETGGDIKGGRRDRARHLFLFPPFVAHAVTPATPYREGSVPLDATKNSMRKVRDKNLCYSVCLGDH